MKSLSVLLSVLVYNTLIRFTASRDVSFEVDGGVLYDITWLSREEVVPDLDPDASGSSDDGVLAELLPNTLLGEGQWAEETIVDEGLLRMSNTSVCYQPLIQTARMRCVHRHA